MAKRKGVGKQRQFLFLKTANSEAYCTSKISGGRRDKVVITRLRLEHRAQNHGLVGKPSDRNCSSGEAKTVRHVLIHCSNYHKGRNILQAELSETGATRHSLKSMLRRLGNKKKNAASSQWAGLNCLNAVSTINSLHRHEEPGENTSS